MKTVKPRVFISYTWRTPGNLTGMKGPVKELADRFVAAGVDCRIDQYYEGSLPGFETPDDWKLWANSEIREADSVLLVCSPGYAEPGSLSLWDVSCMEEDLNSGRVERRKFIPIGFGSFSLNSRYAPFSLLGDIRAGPLYYDLNLNEAFEALLRRIRSDFRKLHPREGVFISYSHRDKKYLERLQTMLKPLVRKKLAVWDDTKIKPGAKWKEDIESALAEAKVAVVLVSPYFLESDFIAEHELPPLLDAAKKEGLVILWVYISHCLYDETEIKDYQAAHDISRPLDSLTPADQGGVLVDVCRKIKAAANPP